ncbi:MAG: DUF362 domain-containing protein [Planctomycetes bacterium]|nr:DUF362 domain-containing protein [Planctomycetota bacterium]
MAEPSRREFLRCGIGLGAAAFLGGCSGPVRHDPNPAFLELKPTADGLVSLARFGPNAWSEACEAVIPQVSDLSWLKKGDSVFLKLASNSPLEHPAVTAPDSVVAVAKYLRERGAGEIWAGDQAGVGHVRLTQTGRVSSTREAFASNGLGAAIERSEATVHCFDDQGWDGYVNAKADFPSQWPEGMWLPKILEQVDHVIYLPRLATHSLAGYTCAVKIAVGWLRDDSRKHLHQKAKTFFEKVAEINHCPLIRDKLRFSLTLGDQALLNIGPDIGSRYDLEGVVAIGATNLVDHDLLASAILRWLDRDETSLYDLYEPYPEHADYWNRYLVESTWGEKALERYTPLIPYELEKGLKHDRCLSHLATLQGYRPKRIEVRRGGSFDEDLMTHLGEFGEGVFALA